MSQQNKLKKQIHNCRKCRQSTLVEIISGFPVYSFGNPEDKRICVVGLNPSTKEYEEKLLSDSEDIDERHKSQMSYFQRRYYPFFTKIENFFHGEVKSKIGWMYSPWEKVGFLDLVKCPTRSKTGQWSGLNRINKDNLIRNCQTHLVGQLKLYKPEVVIPYGTDVCNWFARFFDVSYEPFENKEIQFDNFKMKLLFIPQRQGPYSKPEILWIRKKLIQMLTKNTK